MGTTTDDTTADATAGDELIDPMLRGGVEKGPFVIGSSVLVSEVDSSGLPTGRTFPTLTTSELGEFEVLLEGVDHVAIEASGYYYNEAIGKLSSSAITLRAFYSLAAGTPQAAQVNILTQLANQRVLTLVGTGLELPAAVVQAEDELVVALEIGPSLTIDSPAASLSVVGPNSLGNAYLLAVSSVVAEAARLAAASEDDVWGQTQQLVNSLASDFADGSFSPALKARLAEAEASLMPGVVSDLLGYRLRELQLPATIPDLARGLDSDSDGISNADDNCPLASNPNQAIVPQEICNVEGWVVGVPRENDDDNTIIGSGDVDGDGIDEILAGRGATFEVYGLDATGRFERRSITNTLARPRNFLVADISGDGHNDVIMIVGNSLVATHLGTGTSSRFGGGVLTNDIHVSDRYLVDFNGDGRMDLVRGPTSGTNYYQVALSVGDGSFDVSNLPAPPGTSDPWLGFADIDLDGVPDSVHVNDSDWWETNARLSYNPITGDGGLGPRTEVTLPGTVGMGDATFVLADVNGDAAIDIVRHGAYGSDRWVSVSLGQGNGYFFPAAVSTGFNGEFTCATSYWAKFADLNGDGFADIITSAYECPLSIGLGSASGEFYPLLPWDTFLPHSFWPPHIGGDFNGDGTPDFVFGLASTAPGLLMVGAIISP